MISGKNPEFVVVISEIDKYLQHKNHVLSIQLHKKRKQDLIDILIGWFEADFEIVKYANGKKVKHCSKCGTPYVFAHQSCSKGEES